jgi:hypothetical protein
MKIKKTLRKRSSCDALPPRRNSLMPAPMIFIGLVPRPSTLNHEHPERPRGNDVEG